MSKYDQQWVADYYDEYGEKEWDRWERSPAEQVKFHVHCHYIEQYVKVGDRVLEIGAGAGRFTQILASLGARIVVTDISPRQLELNREHAKEFGFEHAVEAWLLLDMCNMSDLPNEDYNVVVCYGGPLSYVFENRDSAIREIFRVLKPLGFAMFSVMSLWGAVHEYLLDVLQVPPEENAEIIRTGDLHPDTFKDCKHRCHMFTAHELRTFLEKNGFTIACMSASNCLSAAWGDRLVEIQNDTVKWSELLKMEVQACKQPGCLDLGTHIIAVAQKQNKARNAP